MTLKKLKIIDIFVLMFISFIAHNIYQYFPSILVAIFFPINESIFEHMKIIFTSLILTSLIDYIILKLNNISINNFRFQTFITPFISIPIFLTIYLPIHYLLGENLIVTLIILFMTYIISQVISYILLNHKEIPIINQISIPLIILVYFNFLVLTLIPNKDDFFYDTYKTKET